jgi:hypothetical protein
MFGTHVPAVYAPFPVPSFFTQEKPTRPHVPIALYRRAMTAATAGDGYLLLPESAEGSDLPLCHSTLQSTTAPLSPSSPSVRDEEEHDGAGERECEREGAVGEEPAGPPGWRRPVTCSAPLPRSSSPASPLPTRSPHCQRSLRRGPPTLRSIPGCVPPRCVQGWQWVNPHQVWTPQTHPRDNNMTPRVSPYLVVGGGISLDSYPSG